MGSTGDKIKGATNEAVGNIKQGVGRMTGNEQTEAEGIAQERKGEAQQAEGKVKEKIKDSVDKF